MSKLTAVLWLIRTIKIPTHGTKSITFWIKSCYTSLKNSIENFMPEGRNLVCSNGELWVWLPWLNKIENFGNFWTTRIPIERTKWLDCLWKTQAFEWDLDKRNQDYEYRKKTRKSRRFNIISPFWNLRQTIRVLNQVWQWNIFATNSPLEKLTYRLKPWGKKSTSSYWEIWVWRSR